MLLVPFQLTPETACMIAVIKGYLGTRKTLHNREISMLPGQVSVKEHPFYLKRHGEDKTSNLFQMKSLERDANLSF